MTITKSDFLDEMIAEWTAVNPYSPQLVPATPGCGQAQRLAQKRALIRGELSA